VSAGFGVAPLTMSPWVAWLASSHDWRQCCKSWRCWCWLCWCGVILVRRAGARARGRACGRTDGAQPPCAYSSSSFAAVIVLCSPISFVARHTPDHHPHCELCRDLRHPADYAVTIYSVEGLAGLGDVSVRAAGTGPVLGVDLRRVRQLRLALSRGLGFGMIAVMMAMTFRPWRRIMTPSAFCELAILNDWKSNARTRPSSGFGEKGAGIPAVQRSYAQGRRRRSRRTSLAIERISPESLCTIMLLTRAPAAMQSFRSQAGLLRLRPVYGLSQHRYPLAYVLSVQTTVYYVRRHHDAVVSNRSCARRGLRDGRS